MHQNDSETSSRVGNRFDEDLLSAKYFNLLHTKRFNSFGIKLGIQSILLLYNISHNKVEQDGGMYSSLFYVIRYLT